MEEGATSSARVARATECGQVLWGNSLSSSPGARRKE